MNNDTNNANGAKKDKKKIKFPCKLCNEDQLTQKFPKMEDAQLFLVQMDVYQKPTVITNPLTPQDHQMIARYSNILVPLQGVAKVPLPKEEMYET
jgi:hypothetical protein